MTRFRSRLGTGAAIVLITALSFACFPRQTWLQQDSQIYLPILEHLFDPSALAQDPVAVRHHVSFTIYDEMALLARRITGLEFYEILTADQFVGRACGVAGVFLLALSMGLPAGLSLLAAGVYALGAVVMGPAVLTVEYEPKPRGTAMGFLLLAAGLFATGRLRAAGALAGLGFLYHPPTSYPVIAAFGLCLLWSGGSKGRWEALRILVPLAAASVLLLVCSHLQPGGAGRQSWFARLTPELERLQRLRASYNWVSGWAGEWMPHYLFLWALSMAALYRLRASVSVRLRMLLISLPLIGMFSVPASYLFYDVWKWALMAKFQPARALVWVSAAAVVLGAAACLDAARRGGRREAFGWGFFAFLIPVEPDVWNLLLPDPSSPLVFRRLAMTASLALLLTLAGRFGAGSSRAFGALWVVALVAPFLALPYWGRVPTEPIMHEPELRELSVWTRHNTPKDAVFLFPGAGQSRRPGIFRGEALRAVYVDWKGGGQVNMVEDFARDWWQRWQAAMLRPFDPADLDYYRGLGIDYLVLQPDQPPPGRAPVFTNARYGVYATSR